MKDGGRVGVLLLYDRCV